MKKMLLLLTALNLLLGACGAAAPTEEPTPVLTGDDIQNTAVAMAWTMAAQTIEAMPTATFTPLPPTATFWPTFTETPAITNTPEFTPTPLLTSTPVPTATQEGGISLCKWDGESTRLLVVNDTKATATVSIYMTAGSNDKGYGDCYLVVPILAKKQSVQITAPKQGYYYIYAWLDDGKGKQWSVSGGLGTNNPDKHEIHLTETSVKILNP